MRKIIILSLILLFIFNPEQASVTGAQSKKVLEVGFVPDSPPFQYVENDISKGFNIDVLDQIATYQGIKINYHPMSQHQAFKAIEKGEIDILLGVPFTKNNDAIMDFTDSYVTSEISILAHKNSDIENFNELKSPRIALQSSTLEYEYFKNIRNVNLHRIQRQDTGLKLLEKGRADLFVGNYMTMKYYLKEMNLESEYEFIENRLFPLDYSFAVQKENYTLLHQLNRGINTLKLSNDYADIYNKWFDTLDSPISENLKRLLKFSTGLLVILMIVFILSLRWNRQLKKEVNRKTKDLQHINESLEIQIKKTKESDQTKEQVLESSLRGVITIDLNGIILTINSVACDLFNVDRSVLGKEFKSKILIWKELEDKIDRVLETKEQYLDQEINISEYTKDIEYIKYDIQPIYNIDGEVTGVLLFVLDVTQEKKLQDYLFEEEKSEVLIQLVAGLVHEIRNPLTSIKTFVEMIPSKIDNLTFREEIATHVPKEIDRLNKLLESLINYAKPKQQTETIDLSDLVRSTALLFASNIKNKGFLLALDIESEVTIKGDEDQIKQVLINIILNAIESMDNKNIKDNEKPTLKINLYNQENKSIVELVDNGSGMSQETLDHIFDPFYTTKADGTGLGLGISRQFIKENKGEIHLESKLGKGSKFTLVFNKKEDSREENINY